MLILGLAGAAGSGKDTVADYLVARYGFVKFAWSDALYAEVQAAFSLPDQSLLRDRATKDVPTERLALINCQSDEFIGVAIQYIAHESRHLHDLPLSPRRVLQLWGTEYRRAQDQDYWLQRAVERLVDLRYSFEYPEHAPQFFVECGTRFENERELIHAFEGNVWHIRRDSVPGGGEHSSAQSLPVQPGERELWNNSTIAELQQGVDLLLTTAAKFVRCEPMERISGTCDPADVPIVLLNEAQGI